MLQEVRIEELKLTSKRLEALKQLNIFTIEDLLTYYPYRYETIEEIKPYSQGDKVIIEAEVVGAPKLFFKGKMSSMTFSVVYQGDIFTVSIFNRHFLRPHLTLGKIVTIMGKCEYGKHRIVASDVKLSSLKELKGIHPVYTLKNELTPKVFHQIMEKAYASYFLEIDDFVPDQYVSKYRLVNKGQALRMIHFPKDEQELIEALRYLKYEEFLMFQLTMQWLKRHTKKEIVKQKKQFDIRKINAFIKQLPFTLTLDQQKSVKEILNDLRSEDRMYRLLQGDVGCGKTLVASIALYASVLAGYQGALMAPTEILASQHYASLIKLFENTDMRIVLLTGSTSLKEKESIYQRLEDGDIDLLVGTHALIQTKVRFKNLGLVIADEQHRFGVEQRRLLKDKGTMVDFLLMSATPIPRTLAISMFGDMDVSTIKTMPEGRKPVITRLFQGHSMKPFLKDLKEYLSHGGQCYVVCPLVEASESLTSRDVHSIYEAMSSYFKGQYQVGLMHGKMSDELKEETMKAFKEHRIDILVSTTVIEVGVDVSNANMMVIYDADRFGLSQLHQLRGRVGRGNQQGYCFLLTTQKNKETLERLKFLEKSQDGFEISDFDLKLRGPGEVLGEKQSGVPSFAIADVFRDFNILEAARNDASEILEDYFDNLSYEATLDYIKMRISKNKEYVD